MKYRVTVFFDGPRAAFSQRLHDSEITYRDEVPWLWLARWLARGNLGNTGRCGYAIECDGVSIEEGRATVAFVQP